LKRFSFMENMGNRWPLSGGVYFFTAVKRVHGMRVIKPEWKKVRAARKGMAPVAQRLDAHDGIRRPRRAARLRIVKTTAQGGE
jgi:hypothetical protein